MIKINANEMKTIQDLFWIGMSRKIPDLLNKDGGIQLNLGEGSGFKVIENTIGLDYPEWDAENDKLPFPDNSIDVIHAYHFLEHIKNAKGVLEEIDRVLTVGGYANIVVPYYSSQLAFAILDHVTFYTEKTFERTFCQQTYTSTNYEFSLSVHAQFIMGIAERNMALFAQLVKR